MASASPRRRELLASLGVPFEVIPSAVAEETDEGAILEGRANRAPDLLANRLAFAKAWDVAERFRAAHAHALVLGADTVVAAGHPALPTVLGKPSTPEEASDMLRMLSGATHSVYTGVTLIYVPLAAPPIWDSAVIETRVRFRDLTDEDIEQYLATGEPFDKAGGYGIQGAAASFVAAVEGDYYNVVGLPLEQVSRMLSPYYPALSRQ